MRNYLIIILLALLSQSVFAKDAKFSFDYPDSLKKNANAIVLLDETIYTRTTKSDLKKEVYYVITILSDRGDDYTNFKLMYDKFSAISGIECTLYDSNGKKIRKIKSSEIRDIVAFDGFSLFRDSRMKIFSAMHSSYPFTIELSYNTSYNGFFALSSWAAIDNYNIAVKESKITLKYPSKYPINYKEKNIGNVARTESQDDNMKNISWSANNLIAIESEKFSPAFTDQVPMVMFAPEEFVFDNSEGDFTSWKSYGQWRYQLLYNNPRLSEKTKKDLASLQSTHKDKKELCKAVYKYMQAKTRYVSIQEGIGGVKPIDPEIVDEVGYGDCKALSSYTRALLNEVGIQSHFALIGTDDYKIEYPDFASKNQTNHAILCVPLEKDTIWLECTSQTAPFNYLFNGTSNRKALLATSEGGKLATTTKTAENKMQSSAEIKLDSKGGITCNRTITNTGIYFDQNFSKLQMSGKELRESTLKQSSIGNILLNSVKVELVNDEAKIIEQQSFAKNNYATQAGNRIFVELSPFLGILRQTAQKSERRSPVYIEEKSSYEDHVELTLPDGFTLEFCPEGKNIKSEFGQYNSTIEVKNGTVVFHRTFTLEKNIFEKEKYKEFIDFINNSADADKCKLVVKI
jgi:hypothetical protein